jgi:hypothetical protein
MYSLGIKRTGGRAYVLHNDFLRLRIGLADKKGVLISYGDAVGKEAYMRII